MSRRSRYWNGTRAATVELARAIAYRNRVSQLIVFQCDADFNCAPHNVERATLEGRDAGLEAQADWRRVRSRHRSTSSRPRTTSPASCCRGARASTAPLTRGYPAGTRAARRGGGRVVAALRRRGQSCRMGGYAIVNLTAEWALSHGVDAVRARRQRVRQELRACRRLRDRRRDACSPACALSL